MTQVLAAVLEKEPDWSALPPSLPENVRALLRRCLTKDRHRRLRDIGDARLELEEALTVRTAPGAAPSAGRRVPWAAVATALAVGIAGIGAWAWLQMRTPAAPAVVRFAHQLPPGQTLTPGWNPSVMFSPDGRSVAFDYEVDGVATAFQRPINALEQKLLGGVKNLGAPIYSPDGRWVAMVDAMDQKLKKVAVGGGAPVPLVTTDMYGRGDWGRDGFIYFTDRYPGAIQRIPENGGAPQPVTALNTQKREFTHRHAQVLPGGKAIIFTVVAAGMETYNDARIELQTLDTKQRRILIQNGFGPRYSRRVILSTPMRGASTRCPSISARWRLPVFPSK